VTSDLRGWRIALLADTLVNPPETLQITRPSVLAVIESCGYGLLQLPPPGEHRLLLAVIADQLAEYLHHGYAVAAVGIEGEPEYGLHWRRLVPLLRHRGVGLPLRHVIRLEVDPVAEAKRLGDALAEHDLPLEEQKRWRL
jgi:hypothetical protein